MRETEEGVEIGDSEESCDNAQDRIIDSVLSLTKRVELLEKRVKHLELKDALF